MSARVPKSVFLLVLTLSIGALFVGCDSVGAGEQIRESESGPSAEQSSLFEATNTLEARMQTMDKSVTMGRFGAPRAKFTSKSAPSVSLTSLAQVDPPGDTTRASHLTYSGGTVYAGYKAFGPDFKGGIDILDASDPTNILGVSSLGSDEVDVQEVAYDAAEDALYVAAAAAPSSSEGNDPSLLTKVTNFNDPNTSSVGLTGQVGKSVVIAPDTDQDHDVYVATDEETLYRFDASLGNEATEGVSGVEFRSVATIGNDIFTIDRSASLYASSISSAGGLSEKASISSGVGEVAIGRLHARDEPVLNGERLFAALGSKGIAVLDAASGDVLYQEAESYYTSLTLHEDDPDVADEPTDLVYAARPSGIIDVYRVGNNGIDTGDQSTGLDEVGTFDLSELGGVDFGTSPQVNQVMGVGCNVYVANSNEGVVALELGGIAGCGGDDDGNNQPPTANDDSDDTNEGQSTTTDVLANDTDDGNDIDPSTVTVQSGPSDGSVSVDGQTGEVTYTPDSGFTGSDSYTYTVKDGDGAESNEATVTLTVNSGGSALTLQCPAESDIDSNTGLPTGWPSSNEIGFVGEVRIGDGAGNGAGPQTFEYDLSENTSQPDDTGQFDHQDGRTVSFTLTTDSQGNAEFSIGNASDNPLTHTFDFNGISFDGLMLRARADGGDGVRLEDLTLDGSAVGEDLIFTPGQGDPTQDFLLLSGPNFASGFTLEGTFTLSWDQSVPSNSALAFQIKGYDGPNNPSQFLCSSVDNQAPSAQDDTDQTDEGQSTTTDVLANDSDLDGTLDPSTVQVQSGPSDGSATVTNNGTIEYTPDPGFVGDDSYTYTVEDDDGAASNPATVSITVNRCSNPDPNNDLSGSISGGTGTVDNNSSDCSYDIGLAVYKKFDNNTPPGQNITQILNDSDTDRIAPNSSATLDVDPPTCDYQIDLFHGEVIQSFGPGEKYGSRKLDFAQVDNGGLCGPKAVDDNGTTDQGTAITIDVASNDTDGDSNLDPTSVSVTSGPSDGSVTNNGDGTITYTPDPGFSGTDTFVYDICDDDNRCASLIGEEGTVTITVNDTNQPPTANDDTDQTDEGQAITTDVLANDTDPDGSLDESTVAVQNGPSDGSVSVDGSTGEVTYTPDSGFTGDDSYTYTVKDGDGAESNEATVTVTVNAPSAPTPPVDNPKAISFAAFCTTQGSFNTDDVTIVDVLYKNNNPNEPVSIAWTSTTSLSTVVLKSSPDITNHSGGTSGGAASGGGTAAGNDQSPSSPCPDGETLIIKDEDVGDGSGADS